MCCCNCQCCTIGLSVCATAIALVCTTELFGTYAYGRFRADDAIYSQDTLKADGIGPLASACLTFNIMGTVLSVICLVTWTGLACGPHFLSRGRMNKLNLGFNIVTQVVWILAALLKTIAIGVYTEYSFTPVATICIWIACSVFFWSLACAIAIYSCTYYNDMPCACCMDDNAVEERILTRRERKMKKRSDREELIMGPDEQKTEDQKIDQRKQSLPPATDVKNERKESQTKSLTEKVSLKSSTKPEQPTTGKESPISQGSPANKSNDSAKLEGSVPSRQGSVQSEVKV